MLAVDGRHCYKYCMRLLLVLGVLVGGYVYLLMHTTTIVLDQTAHLKATYQSAADYSQKLADQ